MKKLPQINDLVEQVKERVRTVEEEKVASAQSAVEPKAFVSDIARDLYKLAAYLRSSDCTEVTYDDVRELGNQMLRR